MTLTEIGCAALFGKYLCSQINTTSAKNMGNFYKSAGLASLSAKACLELANIAKTGSNTSMITRGLAGWGSVFFCGISIMNIAYGMEYAGPITPAEWLKNATTSGLFTASYLSAKKCYELGKALKLPLTVKQVTENPSIKYGLASLTTCGLAVKLL